MVMVGVKVLYETQRDSLLRPFCHATCMQATAWAYAYTFYEAIAAELTYDVESRTDLLFVRAASLLVI